MGICSLEEKKTNRHKQKERQEGRQKQRQKDKVSQKGQRDTLRPWDIERQSDTVRQRDT